MCLLESIKIGLNKCLLCALVQLIVHRATQTLLIIIVGYIFAVITCPRHYSKCFVYIISLYCYYANFTNERIVQGD